MEVLFFGLIHFVIVQAGTMAVSELFDEMRKQECDYLVLLAHAAANWRDGFTFAIGDRVCAKADSRSCNFRTGDMGRVIGFERGKLTKPIVQWDGHTAADVADDKKTWVRTDKIEIVCKERSQPHAVPSHLSGGDARCAERHASAPDHTSGWMPPLVGKALICLAHSSLPKGLKGTHRTSTPPSPAWCSWSW